jgi:hypothetical protein
MPFNFGGPEFYESPGAAPMNRTERRRIAKAEGKAAKRGRKRKG